MLIASGDAFTGEELARVGEAVAGNYKLAWDHRTLDNVAPFLGMGGENDLLVAGREAVKAEVAKLLRAYGSAGKA